VKEVENFITSYGGDNLLHDIELTFPDLTYRDFLRRLLAVPNS
jgi:hypothetical protein